MQTERIISIDYVGKKRTVDIEIDSSRHIFYGNGIATSNSHSYSYSINAYIAAYCKAHYPLEFYTAWLKHADEKAKPYEEIADLVKDARTFGIDVLPPNILKSEDNFSLQGDKIYYGLANIKGIGQSAVKKLRGMLTSENLKDWSNFSKTIGWEMPSVVKTLIQVGALPFKLTRSRMLFELAIIEKLNAAEIDFLRKTTYNNLGDGLEQLSRTDDPALWKKKKDFTYTEQAKKRLSIIKDFLLTLAKPPSNLEDNIEWIATVEETLLGLPLTCNKIDGKNTMQANTTCEEFVKGNIKNAVVAGTVSRLKEHVLKNGKYQGQTMSFLTISDSSGDLECALFADTHKKYGPFLNEGATVLVIGVRSPKNPESLIVNKVVEI